MLFKTMPTLCATLLMLYGLPAAAEDIGSHEGRGRTLLATHCAGCHAIGRSGKSTHREAPPFRTLGRRYPIDSLAEALGEGLTTGHPDMPEFIFQTRDVGAILAYLQSIQGPGNRRPLNRVIK